MTAPVWMALCCASDWRWLTDREDSPWYPTMRLFRQKQWGDWDEVFSRIADTLRQRSAATRVRQPLLVATSLPSSLTATLPATASVWGLG